MVYLHCLGRLVGILILKTTIITAAVEILSLLFFKKNKKIDITCESSASRQFSRNSKPYFHRKMLKKKKYVVCYYSAL